MALGIIPSANAAKLPDRVERERLAYIRGISRKGTAAENWYFLVACVRAGPTEAVQLAAADALATVKTKRVKDALVAIASDEKAQRMARSMAVRGLKGHVELLEDEDIERILRSDERTWTVFAGTLRELASRADLSLKEVRAIIDRYKAVGPNTKKNIAYFAGQHLKFHKGEDFDGEIRPVLEQFLIDRAHGVGSGSPNLCPLVARMMAENHVPGAVEMLIRAVRHVLEAMKKGTLYSPPSFLRPLRTLTGESMGYNRRLRATDAKNVDAMKKWLAWWEKNKDNPKFRLPPPKE